MHWYSMYLNVTFNFNLAVLDTPRLARINFRVFNRNYIVNNNTLLEFY